VYSAFFRRLARAFVLATTPLAACNTAGLTTGVPGGAADPTCPDGDPTCSAPGTGGGEPSAGDAGGVPRGQAVANAPGPSQGVSITIEPGDDGAAIVDAIKGAQTSVHMTMYLLSMSGGLGTKVVSALGALVAAGKDVKVVLNKTFPPNGGDNQPAYDALTKKNVPVHWASSAYAYTHAKTIIIDSAQSIIMTMNLTESSPTTNREYIAFDTDADDVAVTEQLFAADFDGTPITVSSKLVVSPTSANEMSPRNQLKALIDSATTSLDMEAQELSDKTIVDAIIAAHQANVAVRLLVDGKVSTSPSELAAIAKLKAVGVPLRSLGSLDLHAKCIVVDEARTFVGSQNMTSTALTQNREIGVITDAKSEASKVRGVIAGDFDQASDL
jgi:phosphatidylserine/phosphatidylglycerophosphate/cardiolipin synthase-like enzyme